MDKLRLNMEFKMYINGEYYDTGTITQLVMRFEQNNRSDRIAFYSTDKKVPGQIWLGYIERPDLEPGWRYMRPDPFTDKLTFSQNGPIYELRPMI